MLSPLRTNVRLKDYERVAVEKSRDIHVQLWTATMISDKMILNSEIK